MDELTVFVTIVKLAATTIAAITVRIKVKRLRRREALS
ncbi:hypothetical protein RKLH11_4040 [Rhodobacteraceae bacterium KLH11]|nr:hypothetical protein RKLH11_4040 [Rhodobacteraceae bacterium KLH11]